MRGLGVATFWAASLSRRYWRATVVLVLITGLAGGLVLAAWAGARRGDSAFGRFERYADAPEVALMSCPAGLDTSNPGGAWRAACYAHDQTPELRILQSMPGVVAAGVVAYLTAEVFPIDDPSASVVRPVILTVNEGSRRVSARPLVVSGREARRSSVHELVVDEEFRRQTGLGVGDRLMIVPFLTTDTDELTKSAPAPRGLPQEGTIVGVVRHTYDLSTTFNAGTVYIGPGWFKTEDKNLFWGANIEAKVARGTTVQSILAGLRLHFPGQLIVANFELGPLGEDPTTITKPIGHETAAAEVFSVLMALAALLFVGQSVARQVRREWRDEATLAALGMDRSTMRFAAAWRALILGVGAGIVAVATSLALSPLTPIGLAAKAEIHPGLHVDLFVVGVGGLAVGVAALVAGWTPVFRAGRRTHRPARRSRRGLTSSRLPPSGLAGVALATRRTSWLAFGAAVAGTAIAAAAALVACSIGASLHHLVTEPKLYGVSWDFTVSGFSDLSQSDNAVNRLERLGGVSTIVGMRTLPVEFDGSTLPLVSFDDLLTGPHTISPVIVAGRLPENEAEVALGPVTRRRLGVAVGSRLTGVMTSTASQKVVSLTVVGEAVLSNGFEVQPGTGMVVTVPFYESFFPLVVPPVLAVRLDPGADRDVVIRKVEAAFPGAFAPPVPPLDVQDLVRVDRLPALLAGLITVLAVAEFLHLLVLTVSANQRQLSVLKSIGFTRRQVGATVACFASMIGTIALVLGVFTGAIISHSVWSTVADRMGVIAPSLLPFWAVAVVAAATLLLTNVVAAGPAIRASRIRPAEALRDE